jgi:hypothetical protein
MARINRKSNLSFVKAKDALKVLDTENIVFPLDKPTILEAKVKIRYDDTKEFKFSPTLVVQDDYHFVEGLEEEVVRMADAFFPDKSWQLKSSLFRDNLFRVKTREPLPLEEECTVKLKVIVWIRRPDDVTVATVGVAFHLIP